MYTNTRDSTKRQTLISIVDTHVSAKCIMFPTNSLIKVYQLSFYSQKVKTYIQYLLDLHYKTK